jgi:hypothetical protein
VPAKFISEATTTRKINDVNLIKIELRLLNIDYVEANLKRKHCRKNPAML